MSPRLHITIAAFLLVTSFLAFAYKTETLQELIARAESAKLDDQPALFTDIAERQLKSADELYTAGKIDDARAAVQDPRGHEVGDHARGRDAQHETARHRFGMAEPQDGLRDDPCRDQ